MTSSYPESIRWPRWFGFEFMLCLFCFFYSAHFLVIFQIVNGTTYRSQSLANITNKSFIQAQRGEIYDRKGELLASNKNSLIVSFDFDVLYESKLKEFIANFAQQNSGLTETIMGDMMKKGNSEYSISISDYEYLKNYLFNTNQNTGGIDLASRYQREYELGYAGAHLIGYIQENTPGKYFGVSGLELYYDQYFRGVDGIDLKIERLNGTAEKVNLIKSQRGYNVWLEIDKNWQGALYNSIIKNLNPNALGAGGILMDAEDGAIIAMVSYPSFDPQTFVTGLDSGKVNSILDSPASPFLNRAIGMRLSPGSSLKPVIAYSALDLGIIKSQTEFTSTGCMILQGKISFCEADRRVLGTLDLPEALARSSNIYFCNIAQGFAREFGEAGSIQYFLDSIAPFRLDISTGIDLDGEVRGFLPTPEYIKKTQNRNWAIGDMCNSFIGQGALSVTPIRMATVVASLLNGGTLPSPHIMDTVRDENGKEIATFSQQSISLDINTGVFEPIIQGMRLAVSDPKGSAHVLSKVWHGDIIAKTGSADAAEILMNGKLKEGAHSWVIGGFQYEGKWYVFVLVQQFGGRGFQTLPMVADFLKCLGGDFAGEVCS